MVTVMAVRAESSQRVQERRRLAEAIFGPTAVALIRNHEAPRRDHARLGAVLANDALELADVFLDAVEGYEKR